MKRLCILVCTLIISSAVLGQTIQQPPGPQSPSQGQQIVSGEVIVKFAPGTRGHQVYKKALADEPNSEAELAALATDLSSELGIPVAIDQLSSGQEFIIAVHTDAVLAKLIAYLESRADVKDAHLLTDTKPRRLYRNPTVSVEFRADSQIVEDESALKAFVDEVANQSGIEVTTARAPHTIELEVDIRALTMDLIQRLRQRSDVEYAQANFLMEPL